MFSRTLPTRRAGHQVWAHPYTHLLTSEPDDDDEADHPDDVDHRYNVDHRDTQQVWPIHTRLLTLAHDDNNEDDDDDL